MSRKASPSLEQVVRSPQLISHRKLSPELVEAVLGRLAKQRTFTSAFVCEGVARAPSTSVSERWALTSAALSKCGRQYSLGDAAFRETLDALQAPWLVAACQAGTVAGAPPLIVVAALAKEGSEASHDALMADFERARANTRSDWALRYKLKRIARYATPSASWRALEAAVAQELTRRETSLAKTNTSARALGLDIPLLKWSLYLRSTKPRQSVWVILNDLHKQKQLDYLREGGGREPDLKSVKDLPRVLAAIAKRDKLSWHWAEAQVRTNLRGSKRAAFLEWAQGLRATPS